MSFPFLTLIIFLFIALASPVGWATGEFVMKPIERYSETSLTVHVRSRDPMVESIARRAFGLHGGFRTVAGDEATFKIDIEPVGVSSVQLRVGSGRVYVEQLRRIISGNDLQNAVLRACDLVVEATLQSKGFFAGKLAFVGEQDGITEIYSSDLLFNQVIALTRDRAPVTHPEWSPNGRYLVYTSYHQTGFPDIYMLDIRRARKIPIAIFKGTNTGAVFSPDGQRLAMSLSGTGNAEIYVSDTKGRNRRRLTKNRTLEANPAWSPDGQRLIYTSDAPGRPQLYEISVNGGPPRRIPTNISRYCAEPAWNPVDRNRIAFTAAVGKGFQLALYDFKQGRSRILTKGHSSVEPVWMRDGRHLVFTERSQQRTRLMLLDTVTEKIRPLHKESGKNTSSAGYVYPNSNRSSPHQDRFGSGLPSSVDMGDRR